MMGGGAVKQASDGDYEVSVRDLEERMRGSPSVHSKSNCGLLPTSIVKGACHRLDSNLYNLPSQTKIWEGRTNLSELNL